MRRFLARAEVLGFESAWTQEQVLGTMPTLTPLETMAFAAACSQGLRLGCAVLVLPLHSPVHVAKSLAALDQLSRGRIEIGFALGGRFRMLSAFAVGSEGLSSRFVEQIELMKLLWTESRIDFDGRFSQLSGAAMEPKPFQKPYPPLWFGGGHPNAVRRAVTLGHGFFGAGIATTEQFAEQTAVLREELERADTDPSSFRVAKRVYITVHDDRRHARDRMREALSELYGYFGAPDLLPAAVAGTPEDCVVGLRAVAKAGADSVLLNPLFDELEQMERLASQVITSISDAP
jgi:alkanesulfonate monooxygenase SsuD/methylene tetrahydromethanopterin reductase-like flavin-dependent oxidoreductase (luciferase family)